MPNSTKEIYDELIRIAKNDNIISDDEVQLINNIMRNVEEYFAILDKSNEDGIIDGNEHHNLYQQRKKIIEEAISQAKTDELVSKEEFNLLMGLRKIVATMERNQS